jgi:hypothetical protein
MQHGVFPLTGALGLCLGTEVAEWGTMLQRVIDDTREFVGSGDAGRRGANIDRKLRRRQFVGEAAGAALWP